MALDVNAPLVSGGHWLEHTTVTQFTSAHVNVCRLLQCHDHPLSCAEQH